MEGSMKLGPVKTGQGDYLKCSIPDSDNSLHVGPRRLLSPAAFKLYASGPGSRDQVTSTSHSR